MAATTLCNPCLGEDKSSVAIRYCTDCEEQLCEECFVSHSKFKAFKSHRLLALSSVGSKIPITTKYCDILTQIILDFNCTNDDCGAFVPSNHGLGTYVAPLENVFEGIRISATIEDSLTRITQVIQESDRLLENRGCNVKSLHEKEAEIIYQIRTIKSRFIKRIDDLEKDLILQLRSIKLKNEQKLNEEIEELSKLKDHLVRLKRELQSLREQGSDKLLVLRQILSNIDRAEANVQKVASSLDVDIQFVEIQLPNLELFGSIAETSISSGIYANMRGNKVQIPVDALKPITELKKFKKDGQLKLKSGEKYTLRNMVIISNKLLLTNYHSKFPKVYIYKDCKEYSTAITCSSAPYSITAIPDTDKAVVTLPVEQSIQFINTANMTKGNKVKLGVECVGITATKDKIFVGGNAEIHVLDHLGSHKSTISVLSKNINFLHYDAIKDHILCRSNGDLICVKVDGTQVYQYQVSGSAGVAVDRRGDVYVGGYHSNTIEKYTSEGVYHETVLSADDGIKYPYGLSFNNDCNKLFVINNNWKTVEIYSCL